MSVGQRRKKRVAVLERRLEFLDERINSRVERVGFSGKESWDVAEAYALEWALGIARKAIETGQIDDLEGDEVDG